ncbi:MAG: transglutaminase family protein [Pirellulaceae bacterium]|nr:transglutaminase family protein [Pirellulaceae bacterium]
MKYAIQHKTIYQYATPVSLCQNVVMLTPRVSPYLSCSNHRLTIRPTPTYSHSRTDAMGNHVTVFAIEESHNQLTITSSSNVVLIERLFSIENPSPSVQELTTSLDRQTARNWFDAVPFRYDSARIRRSQLYADFIRGFIDPSTPTLQVLHRLSEQIHRGFQYSKDATKVDTPTEEAFNGRAGVCQDFAHIAIACLRSIGIPARYVSGYLRTIPPAGKTRLVGADQSHAWVSAWCGDELGWVDIDPTNHCFCKLDHIAVAWGRDYSDVVPIKGVFLGTGEPKLEVSVDVRPEA